MAIPWQDIHKRGQQTLAVWHQHSPGFTVGKLDLAGHKAAVDGLPPAAQAQKNQEDVVDAARAARDGVGATIKDLATRLPRKLDGDLDPDEALHGDLDDIRAVEMTSLDAAADRGRKTLSLWTKYNARLAAQTPPAAELKVGNFSAADLSAALDDLPKRTQKVEDEIAVLNDRRSDLRTLRRAVDSGNKRWFAAWEGEFKVGTPERDALSQIDTEGSGPDHPPAPPTPPTP